MSQKLPVLVKSKIEETLGRPIRYPSDCERLMIHIRETINENIGVTTIKRLFGFVDDVLTPRLSTLDILGRYCGYPDYNTMVKILAEEEESGFEQTPDIESAELSPGANITFEYLPDRHVSLEYLGNLRYRVKESEKGSLRPGDIVTVDCFVKEKPLIISAVERDGKNMGRYIAGKVSGLISLHLYNPSADD